jgi:plasmid stabilization system protein ParE
VAYHVEVTDRALRDLSIIYGSIGAESSKEGARWFDRLERAIFSLEKYPNRAPLTPEDPTVRHLLYGRKPYVYRIIYEVDEKTSTVYVLHIRWPGRDRMKRR